MRASRAIRASISLTPQSERLRALRVSVVNPFLLPRLIAPGGGLCRPIFTWGFRP